MLHKILEASYLNRKKDLGFGFGSRNVEGNTVEVGDSLVDRRWRGAGQQLAPH
jgi:hypothetical protein